jgi:hypothetical protein
MMDVVWPWKRRWMASIITRCWDASAHGDPQALSGRSVGGGEGPGAPPGQETKEVVARMGRVA